VSGLSGSFDHTVDELNGIIPESRTHGKETAYSKPPRFDETQEL